MNPTAIVTSDPEQIGDETVTSGLIKTRTYRMNISATPHEPMRTVRDNEPITFPLYGQNIDTRVLSPGTAVHITFMDRDQEGALFGEGIHLVRLGTCVTCGKETLVQLTPEDPARTECAQCIAQVMKISIVPDDWEMPRLE